MGGYSAGMGAATYGGASSYGGAGMNCKLIKLLEHNNYV